MQVVRWSADALQQIYFHTPDKILLNNVTELLLAHDGITAIIKNMQHTDAGVSYNPKQYIYSTLPPVWEIKTIIFAVKNREFCKKKGNIGMLGKLLEIVSC